MIIEYLLKIFSKVAYAAPNTDPVSPPPAINPSDAPPTLSQLANVIDGIFEYIFPIGAIIAVAMIIYGGYMWIISGGDPARKQQAQGVLTWSILGLAFLFLIKMTLTILVNYIYQ